MVLIPNEVCDRCRIADKPIKQYDTMIRLVTVADPEPSNLHWLCVDCLKLARARTEAACSPPAKRGT